VVELCFPRQRALSNYFITLSREGAKKVRLADNLRDFAASRETNSGLPNVSAFGG
jgi:hypothetical protein